MANTNGTKWYEVTTRPDAVPGGAADMGPGVVGYVCADCYNRCVCDPKFECYYSAAQPNFRPVEPDEYIEDEPLGGVCCEVCNDGGICCQ